MFLLVLFKVIKKVSLNGRMAWRKEDGGNLGVTVAFYSLQFKQVSVHPGDLVSWQVRQITIAQTLVSMLRGYFIGSGWPGLED